MELYICFWSPPLLWLISWTIKIECRKQQLETCPSLPAVNSESCPLPTVFIADFVIFDLCNGNGWDEYSNGLGHGHGLASSPVHRPWQTGTLKAHLRDSFVLLMSHAPSPKKWLAKLDHLRIQQTILTAEHMFSIPIRRDVKPLKTHHRWTGQCGECI